jgi:serine/threonine protein kinase
MIDTFGQVKLIDYGAVLVASLDENKSDLVEELPQGSLNYIAPETLLTMKADHLSDLFSLGVICYEMLTGEQPYKPMTRAQINFNNTSSWHYRSIKKYRPDLPFWLDLSLQQATHPEAKARYQAYSEFEFGINKADLAAMEAYKQQPLLERDPVKFWQGVAFVLFIVLIVQSL